MSGEPDWIEGENVDREIRIEKLRHQIEDIAGGPIISGSCRDVSPESEEDFLSRVLAYEQADQDSYYNRLLKRGMILEPASELDDATLTIRLNQLLQSLAEVSCFVHDTDHLSDRQLYSWLRDDGLREETVDAAQLGGAWHTSPIGSGSEEDTEIFLKYYATAEERGRWAKEFPHPPLPEPEPRPYDRDRTLPREEY